MEDKPTIIAYVMLIAGICLLAFTFICAYTFLINDPSIVASSDLLDVFGSALAPLIGASIRIMYLGVMGWIGAALTSRGVQFVTQLKHLSRPIVKPVADSVVKPKEIQKKSA
ncbi:MAG: hypothetical protein NWF02_01685 [Candidatus Bathyarchaeota archaeon]|nr:hypothetical protein [Candidatus Bathyarchaeum sp.]